jgi:hypothetical protein
MLLKQKRSEQMRFCTPTAIKAYEAMLAEVRAANGHLSEKELREARDEYSRKLRGIQK